MAPTYNEVDRSFYESIKKRMCRFPPSPMEKLNTETIQTEVLVIGAGGAGLRAAIGADDARAEVLVVSKGRFPDECNTAIAGGAMLAPLGEGDSAEKYLQDTITAGAGVNYLNLVRVMADNGGMRALDLERFGARYHRDNGRIRLWSSSDNSVDRVLPAGAPYSGDWFQILVNEAERRGINVYDQLMILELLKSGQTITGAIGLDLARGKIVAIYAKSTILTTGGAGSLYTFTSNHKGITGDGLALAYRAGAALSHLEFVQMRQCIIYPHELRGALPPFDGFVAAGGRFYNGLNERYMKRYHPTDAENVTRAEIARCAQLEIIAGRVSRHSGIYGDLSGVPEKTLFRVKKFVDACRDIDFDPTFQSLEWAPASHHTMGGVLINGSCQSGVPGLFAAGEVVAGVQGANRMGGNALTETQVFGAIAGKSAGTRARGTKDPQAQSRHGEKIQQLIATIRANTSGTHYLKVKSKIQRIMSEDVGVIRHGDTLLRAKNELDEIQMTQIDNLFLGTNTGLEKVGKLLEVQNMFTLARLMVQAALLRTESRGAHQRQDYPELDPRWEKHIIFRHSLAGPEVQVVPTVNSLRKQETHT